MRNPDKGPLAHHEQNVHSLDRHGPCQFRETHVVADDYRALQAVQLECGQMVSLIEKLILIHRGEKVRLVVLRHAFSLPVEDIAGIVHPVILHVGHASADNVHTLFQRDARKHRLGPAAVVVGKFLKVLLREESCVPGLRQNNGIRSGLNGPVDENLSLSEVLVRIGEHHIHLNACNFHRPVLTVYCALSYR